jgi:hypothetical protein
MISLYRSSDKRE